MDKPRISNKIIYSILWAVYIVSWVLPIYPGAPDKTIPGYLGAFASFSGLYHGVLYFFVGAPHSILSNGFAAFMAIFSGLPNVLFLLCFPLLISKPKWAYFLSPLMVTSMLAWVGKDNMIGYYLWLACGLVLFLLSAVKVKKNVDLKWVDFFLGTWSLAMYIPLFLLSLSLLSNAAA